jgi:hypothetical protein
MNTSRTASLRGFGKAALAGLLMVLLFLAALAACDSHVHALLHPDHDSPTHYCLVTLLGHGHGEAPVTVVFVHVSDSACTQSYIADAAAISSPDCILHSGRGPPRVG